MKKIFYTILICGLPNFAYSQMGPIIDRMPNTQTIFDSLLVSKKKLTCNQYYNKLISDYYKQNNYKGHRSKISMSLYAIYSKETPFLTINGIALEQYDFDEIMKFKKIIAFEIKPELKKAWKGEAEKYGKIAFKAEK